VRANFRDSFMKDLGRIKNRSVLKSIKDAIEGFEKTQDLQDVPNLKKLRGGNNYYRIRIGDYRIGLSIQSDCGVFIRCLHRKDIYRYFP
jgi:mRNA interferase RelE/StbE